MESKEPVFFRGTIEIQLGWPQLQVKTAWMFFRRGRSSAKGFLRALPRDQKTNPWISISPNSLGYQALNDPHNNLVVERNGYPISWPK